MRRALGQICKDIAMENVELGGFDTERETALAYEGLLL